MFTPTEEEKALQDTVRRLLEGEVNSAYLRRRIESPTVNDEALWQKINELGIFSHFSSEGEGTFRELGDLAYECGRVLVPLPLWQSVLFGSRRLGKGDQDKKLAADISAGKAHVIGTFCDKVKPNSELTLELVSCAASASHLMILADKAYLLELKDAHVEAQPSLDLTQNLFKVTFNSKKLKVLSSIDNGQIKLMTKVLYACELSGLCSRVVEMTNGYVKTRKQFGVAIGAFQAVAHRLADMYVQTEAMWALARFAAWAVDRSPEQSNFSALAALANATQVASQIVEGAIQLHGGIGFTWEFDLHLYLRRAKAIEALWGMKEEGYDELIGAVG